MDQKKPNRRDKKPLIWKKSSIARIKISNLKKSRSPKILKNPKLWKNPTIWKNPKIWKNTKILKNLKIWNITKSEKYQDLKNTKIWKNQKSEEIPKSEKISRSVKIPRSEKDLNRRERILKLTPPTHFMSFHRITCVGSKSGITWVVKNLFIVPFWDDIRFYYFYSDILTLGVISIFEKNYIFSGIG